MNDEPIEQLELQIASMRSAGSPRELRGAVLGQIERELRSSRWDRRLARTAVALVMVAVGLNGAATWQGSDSTGAPSREVVNETPRQSLVATAVVVAEATDAATGRQFARQLAAISGRELTADETAAIDAAIARPMSHAANGRRG